MKLVLSHYCIDSSSKLRWNCFVLGALFDHFLEEYLSIRPLEIMAKEGILITIISSVLIII